MEFRAWRLVPESGIGNGAKQSRKRSSVLSEPLTSEDESQVETAPVNLITKSIVCRLSDSEPFLPVGSTSRNPMASKFKCSKSVLLWPEPLEGHYVPAHHVGPFQDPMVD